MIQPPAAAKPYGRPIARARRTTPTEAAMLKISPHGKAMPPGRQAIRDTSAASAATQKDAAPIATAKVIMTARLRTRSAVGTDLGHSGEEVRLEPVDDVSR